MDLRQLRYFEAVVRHRHFTRAAEELHIAQSALSHQVRSLERELGVELLQRTTRSVQPTEAGELVVARARAVLAEADALREDVDELRGLHRGHVKVGAMLFGGELDIPAILADFTAAYPDIEVSLQEGTGQRMIEFLGDGSLDLSFALEFEPPEGIERRRLSSEELALATSPNHPLAGSKPLPISALHEHPLIAFHHGASSRLAIDAALARAGARPRISLEANDFALVRALVARGVGVAILPRSYLERPGLDIAFRPLSPPVRMTVALWWRRGRSLSPAAQRFVEFASGYGRDAKDAAGTRRTRRPA